MHDELNNLIEIMEPGYACGKHSKNGHGLLHFRPYNINIDGQASLSEKKLVDPQYSDKRLCFGDVVFNNTNSDVLVGKTCFYGYREKVGFSNHMTRIVVKKERLNPKFLAYQLHSFYLRGLYKSIMKNHVNQSSVNMDRLKKLIISVPDLEVQSRITDSIETQFTRLDAAIKSLKAIKTKLETYRQSVLSDSLKQAKQVGKKLLIKDACSLINGRAFKPTEWGLEGLPIIRIQNLNNPTAKFNYCDFAVDQKYYIEKGDLLFAWSGTPGTSFGAHIWEKGQAVLNQHIFKVVLDESRINKKYFMHTLNNNVGQYIQKAHGAAGLAHITKAKFEMSEVYIPSKNLQDKLVDEIESRFSIIDKVEEVVDNALLKADRLRKSILKSAFEGKLVD